MKRYVKDAVNELLNSNKRVIEVELKDKNDYKKNFLRLGYNKFILAIQTRMVPMHLKNIILRTNVNKLIW